MHFYKQTPARFQIVQDVTGRFSGEINGMQTTRLLLNYDSVTRKKIYPARCTALKKKL